MGHRDRLRRRLIDGGTSALGDYELLELVLFGAIPRRDTKPLAKALIEEFGSLGGVMAADPAALARRGGLGPAAVALLGAVAAIGERSLRERVMNRPVLANWRQLLDYLHAALRHRRQEEFRLLFLDRKNRLIADEVQQRGTVDHAPVYPREVARRALELHASAVIMVHNHPGGDPTPSRADVEITRQVDQALKAVQVTLHDHLVIGLDEHASFKTLRLL
jgi:DNA repair protein RadC